jgi:hypothetical protein
MVEPGDVIIAACIVSLTNISYDINVVTITSWYLFSWRPKKTKPPARMGQKANGSQIVLLSLLQQTAKPPDVMAALIFFMARR